MRVLHIFWGLSFGGIETMLVNIANLQVAEGAEVSIIIINEQYEESLLKSIDSKIRLIFLKRKLGSYNPWFIVKLNLALRNIKPDVIHIHRSELYNFIGGRKFKRKVCVTLHDLPIGAIRHSHPLHTLFNKKRPKTHSNVRLIDRILKVFAISQAVKDALMQNYGVDSIVVNNGIATANFKHRRMEKPAKSFKIIQVSRLEHNKKGQDLLIEAAALLKGKVQVDFVGIGSSMDYLKQLAKELKVEEQVRFLGKQPQSYIAEHLRDYDLFVQASRWEGFGLTVAEAMAAKVPVLVSAGQGPAEVTCGNKYGWLFDNGDANNLAQQIDHIYANYDQALVKASDAYKYVIANYDVRITVQKYHKLYIDNNKL